MDFLSTFFAEKDLAERTYEVEAADGTLNLVPTSSVIERILTTRGQERRQIETILRTLDIRNGDVHHFLQHLAQAMAVSF